MEVLYFFERRTIMLFLVLELLFYFIVGYGVVSLFGRIKGLQSEKKTKEVED